MKSIAEMIEWLEGIEIGCVSQKCDIDFTQEVVERLKALDQIATITNNAFKDGSLNGDGDLTIWTDDAEALAVVLNKAGYR